MGIQDPPSDIIVSPETSRGGSGNRTGNPHFATNQFYGLEDVEPASITRTSVDNPEFSWPQKQHMDQSGRTYTIQRGYMRSLITDPMINKGAGVPNRRVFFQFNPFVLQREVQQSVGTMMPLLQDPAQLLQPVPGTTQFSFQLMFNREHEVNKGIDDPEQDWLKLPGSGEKALVSQIGVLADLMMLDSITGQGLSEDMLTSLVNRTKRQYQNYNTAVTNAKIEDQKEGIDVEENAKDYKTVQLPEAYDTDPELSKLFEANIGNSAFLNPLPFRVMFSSLFMVEGVATSVSVSFNKFSKTMVPTQCLVTINMYALYLGFAKQKTFIYDNLIKAAEEDAITNKTDEEAQQMLDKALISAKAQGYMNSFDQEFKVFDIKLDEKFIEQCKSKKLVDVSISFDMVYKFTHDADQEPLPKIGVSTATLVQKDKSNRVQHDWGTKNVSKLSTDPDIFLSVFHKDEEGNDSITNPKTTWLQYITFQIVVRIQAKTKAGNVLEGKYPLTETINWKAISNDGVSSNSEISAYERKIVETNGTTGNTP